MQYTKYAFLSYFTYVKIYTPFGHFGVLGGTKNGTSGARIKILRPLFNTNTPLKPPFIHFGNHFGPRKSDFWPFYFFGHFPIEIPIESKKNLPTWEGVEPERKQNVF